MSNTTGFFFLPLDKIPQRSIYPATQNVLLGHNAALTCHAHGQDIKNVAWYKEKVKVSDGVPSNDRNGNYNSTLTITTSGLEVGTYIYECRVFLKYTHHNLASYPGYWPATAELQIGALSMLIKLWCYYSDRNP